MKKYYMDPMTGNTAATIAELKMPIKAINAYPVFIVEEDDGSVIELVDDPDIHTMYINMIMESSCRYIVQTLITMLTPLIGTLDFSVEISDFINKSNKKMYCLSVHVKDYSPMPMLDGERLTEFIIKKVNSIKEIDDGNSSKVR
jgi:hypothetical protein